MLYLSCILFYCLKMKLLPFSIAQNRIFNLSSFRSNKILIKIINHDLVSRLPFPHCDITRILKNLKNPRVHSKTQGYSKAKVFLYCGYTRVNILNSINKPFLYLIYIGRLLGVCRYRNTARGAQLRKQIFLVVYQLVLLALHQFCYPRKSRLPTALYQT